LDDSLSQFTDAKAIDAFAIKKALQLAEACGVSHFPESLGFDLPNALAGYFELFAHFLERTAVTVGETEAELENFAFTLSE